MDHLKQGVRPTLVFTILNESLLYEVKLLNTSKQRESCHHYLF